MTRLSVRAMVANRDIVGGLRTALPGGGGLRGWMAEHRDQAEIWWRGQSATALMRNGPDGAKLTIVVLGDGYSKGGQATFNRLVDDLFLDPTTGLFGQDYFALRKQAFNLIRVNLESAAATTNTRVYNDDGDIVVQHDFDTALGYYFNGEWEHGWIDDGPDTVRRVQQALNIWAPEHHNVFVIINHAGHGGVATGSRAVITRAEGWDTVAHELGHAIGGLGDEYHNKAKAFYDGLEPNAANLTKETERDKIKWKNRLHPFIEVPTRNKPSVWDDNNDVGVFEGATIGQTRYAFKLYRPAISCRMNSNLPNFCPVCRDAMDLRTVPRLDSSLAAARSEGVVAEPYLRMVVRHEDGELSVVSARVLIGGLVPDPAEPMAGLAHQVTVDQRVVASAALAGANVTHTINDPVRGHHIRTHDNFDFVVRVPLAALAGTDLDDVTLRLVDLPGPDTARVSAPQPRVALQLGSAPPVTAALRRAADG